MEQLSPCATTTEPALLESVSYNYWAHVPQLPKPMRLEPVLRNKGSHHNEKPAHRKEEQPLLAATRESPCAATKTPYAAKNKQICKKKKKKSIIYMVI